MSDRALLAVTVLLGLIGWTLIFHLYAAFSGPF